MASQIDKQRAKLAGYLYRLTKWVAPPWPEQKPEPKQVEHDWDDEQNFGERPF